MADGQQIPTKERLARALEELPPINGRERLVKRARAGFYDDYESHLPFPQMQLVEELRNLGQETFAQRVINGEFDGTKEEADAWAKSPEGRETFMELMFPAKLPMTAERKCPYCNESNIDSMGTSPGGPGEGDASLCLYCEKWGVFDAELLLRKPTDEELNDITSNPVAQKALEGLREWKKEHGKQ